MDELDTVKPLGLINPIELRQIIYPAENQREPIVETPYKGTFVIQSCTRKGLIEVRIAVPGLYFSTKTFNITLFQTKK